MMRSRTADRSVLLVDFDFFSTIGGGQTFYKKVVRRNPTIAFTYLSRGPDLDLKGRGQLPENAWPVPLAPPEASPRPEPCGHSTWYAGHLKLLAAQVAQSVAGRHFDAVDVPSFTPLLTLLAKSFRRTGVSADRTVLSLMGWMSVGIANGYEAEDLRDVVAELRQIERACARAADDVYVIARRHQREVEQETGRRAVLLDTHDLLDEMTLPPAPPALPDRPDLVFFGRIDGNKGPDLFIDLVSRLPRDSFRRCRIAGPDSPMASGDTWLGHLRKLAAKRGVEFEYEGTPPTGSVAGNLFGDHAVVVIPSRSDILPLVAFEALAAGSPVALSTTTGAYAFLRQHYPDLPVMPFDIADIAASAATVHRFLDAYPQSGRAFRQAFETLDWRRYRDDFMESLYFPRRKRLTARLSGWLRRAGA